MHSVRCLKFENYPLCPQLSQHCPDQCESVLPAPLHQRHPEDLPERRQGLSLSQRHRLLHSCVPLPWTTEQQLWYDSLFCGSPFSHTATLDLLSAITGSGSVLKRPAPESTVRMHRMAFMFTPCPTYSLSPQSCGWPPCWTTGSCRCELCLMTTPTDRLSWQSELKQDTHSATSCPSTSMWVSVHPITAPVHVIGRGDISILYHDMTLDIVMILDVLISWHKCLFLVLMAALQ